MDQVDDKELLKVMGDFLEMGHVDNIIAMYRRDPLYYGWTGDLLDDDRLSVRLGVSILFEELRQVQQDKLPLAIPSLVQLLGHDSPTIRGEAICVLGIIGTREALEHIQQMCHDDSAQVREVALDILDEYGMEKEIG